MWTRRAAAETLLAAALVAPAAALSQPPAPAPGAVAPAPAEELILTLRANGVERGEFTLLRQADGDFWVRDADLARLQLKPAGDSRREAAGENWHSLRALGGRSLAFLEAELALAVDFPVADLAGTRIDLSNRAPIEQLDTPAASLILSYRLAARSERGGGQRVVLDNDWNVRVGGLLLRQETHFDSRRGQGDGARFQRGRTQAIWDDTPHARRIVAGDVVSSAGPFGSVINGGGVLLRKVHELAPHIIPQPAASLRAATALPAEVEVAVDGNTVHRASVPPGPIDIDNLLLYGGARTVRVTVTDAAGRREVYEQPFMFTDSVLAAGLHEYSYFAGRRSELDGENRWRYREPALQGWHRYGVTDHLTVSAGGEGNADFANAGAGLALRSDRLGVLSLELLASRDRMARTPARGWSARYTYLTPAGAVLLSHRRHDEGFRTFTTSALAPFLREESRIGFSTRILSTTLSADLVRTTHALEDRLSASLRLAANLGRGTSMSAELLGSRTNGEKEWTAWLFLRQELDAYQWVGSTARKDRFGWGVDVDTGRRVSGEGLGYRAGVSTQTRGGVDARWGYLAANWNLRPATLEFYGSSPLGGGGGQFSEIGIAGALVAVDGSWGFTRRVDDSFVLARLGVPQAGVDVLLNNRVQGATDARGELFLPEVGALSRQDVAVDDRQLDLAYSLVQKRQTVTPAPRSGVVVHFGGRKQSAVAGSAWRLDGTQKLPIAARAWTLRGAGATLQVETGSAGDFYLEDVAAGRYAGTLDLDGTLLQCELAVPAFQETVHELTDGILCK